MKVERVERERREGRTGSPVRRGIGRGGLAPGVAAAALALILAGAACSLTNLKPDACTSDAQCAAAFGAGSTCAEGYCLPSTGAACDKKTPDGRPCFGCPPKLMAEFENACTSTSCVPFDDAKRLTKLTPDGGLPALP